MTRIAAIVVGTLLTSVACAYNPPPVPLQARPAEIERLAGRWTGTYDGDTSGRSGSIELVLAAGEDHAHGEVWMVPRHQRQPYQSWRELGPVREAETSEILTIRFVALEEGEVSGELEPYRDPDCDCRAVTRFRGRLGADGIEGTFVTNSAEAARPAGGRWKVRRVPSRP